MAKQLNLLKSFNLTGSFQQLDKEGSGAAEMNLTEVSDVVKNILFKTLVVSNFCF